MGESPWSICSSASSVSTLLASDADFIRPTDLLHCAPAVASRSSTGQTTCMPLMSASLCREQSCLQEALSQLQGSRHAVTIFHTRQSDVSTSRIVWISSCWGTQEEKKVTQMTQQLLPLVGAALTTPPSLLLFSFDSSRLLALPPSMLSSCCLGGLCPRIFLGAYALAIVGHSALPRTSPCSWLEGWASFYESIEHRGSGGALSSAFDEWRVRGRCRRAKCSQVEPSGAKCRQVEMSGEQESQTHTLARPPSLTPSLTPPLPSPSPSPHSRVQASTSRRVVRCPLPSTSGV